MEPGDGSYMTSGSIHYAGHNRSELEALASFWRAPSLIRARNGGINPPNARWRSVNTNVAVCSARKRPHTDVGGSVATPCPTAMPNGLHLRALMDHS